MRSTSDQAIPCPSSSDRVRKKCLYQRYRDICKSGYGNRKTDPGQRKLPPERYVRDPAAKPVASITRTPGACVTSKGSDFLRMHLLSRGYMKESCIQETINLANQFTGEPITAHVRMTSLSGGQTRSPRVQMLSSSQIHR